MIAYLKPEPVRPIRMRPVFAQFSCRCKRCRRPILVGTPAYEKSGKSGYICKGCVSSR